MKTLLSAFLIFWHAFACAQQPCEDLVYNTRELTSFAYNTRCKTEAYPFISEDGLHLYFTNNQTKDWLFYSHRDHIQGVWSVPVPLQIDHFQHAIRSCYIDPGNGNLYFNGENGITYLAEPDEQSRTHFKSPTELKFKNRSGDELHENVPFSCISMTPDGREMVAYLGGGEKSMGRFIRNGDYEFIFEEYLSATLNEIGTLSSDGLTYYFVSSDDNLLYCRKRTSVGESFGNTVFLSRAFEPQLQITQPRVVMGGSYVVLVLSQGLWEKNEIYFYESDEAMKSDRPTDLFVSSADQPVMQTDLPVMVPEKDVPEPVRKIEITDENKDGIVSISIGEAFPNPARGQFYFYYKISGTAKVTGKPVLVLTDLSGKVVYSVKLDQMLGEVKVEPDRMSSGLYFFRIEYGGITSANGKVQLTF